MMIMDERQIQVQKYLNDIGISYELYNHEPCVTMELCEEADKLTGAPHCKNLFLTNRQGTEFFLVLIDPNKRFRTAEVSKQLGVSRLSFGTDDKLHELLNATAGAITPLAAYYDTDKRVCICYDDDLDDYEYICVHPMVSTASLELKTADLKQVILTMGHQIRHILPSK